MLSDQDHRLLAVWVAECANHGPRFFEEARAAAFHSNAAAREVAGAALEKMIGYGKWRKRKQVKTWKQGVIGILTLPNSNTLFIKCLKYPLGKIFESYDSKSNSITVDLFLCFLELSTLKFIERIGFQKLTKDEHELSESFTMDYQTSSISIRVGILKPDQIIDKERKLEDASLYDIERIQKKYLQLNQD